MEFDDTLGNAQAQPTTTVAARASLVAAAVEAVEDPGKVFGLNTLTRVPDHDVEFGTGIDRTDDDGAIRRCVPNGILKKIV